MKLSGALFLAALAFSTTTAIADAQLKADKQSVDEACAADAKTAGCGSEEVGKGLIKCLDNYKKANRSWKESASCSAARKTLHQAAKARKEEKAATQSSGN